MQAEGMAGNATRGGLQARPADIAGPDYFFLSAELSACLTCEPGIGAALAATLSFLGLRISLLLRNCPLAMAFLLLVARKLSRSFDRIGKRYPALVRKRAVGRSICNRRPVLDRKKRRGCAHPSKQCLQMPIHAVTNAQSFIHTLWTLVFRHGRTATHHPGPAGV